MSLGSIRVPRTGDGALVNARLISCWLFAGLSLLGAFASAQEPFEESSPSSSPSSSLTAFAEFAGPNMVPYQPSGWSDKIVVSKGVGTNLDSSPLAATDTLYVDWAVLNNGNVATAARFYTELYVDGVLRNTWFTDPPLNSNFYSFVGDYSIGSLAAGTHTIRIKADSTNAIADSDETDNEYTKTITVGGGGTPCVANATTLCLNAGRFQVRVGFQTSTTPSGTGTGVRLTGDTGYFWFFSSSNVELVVKILDGRSFNNRYWLFYGALSDVAYTITVTDTVTGVVKTYSNPQGHLASVADTGAFAGSNFAIVPLSDEAVGPTIASMPIAGPNMVPYQPSGWSDKIVVSKGVGTNLDSSPLAATDTLYVDWAVLNNGNVATAARFYTELYVDGVLRNTWFTDPPLNSNFYSFVGDYSIGSLAAGTHTIRIKADSTNAIADSDETDNEYTKTITVGGGGTPCVANATTLCLNAGRFQVRVGFQTSTTPSGTGTGVRLTGDTGYFWFFSSSNVELVVKILDGRSFNNRYWLFYGALSDVAYTITVTDTVTGCVKTYSNPQGHLASVADTNAFDPSGCVSPPPPPGGNHAPTLARVDATRISHSFGRDDGLRSEGVASRPGFSAMAPLTAPRIITLDNGGDGIPDSTSPIVIAAAGLPSCCTLLVAEGAADPDGDALVFQWQAVTGTFYSTGTDGSGGFAFGQKITDVSLYNRNSVFYELPSIGNVIPNFALMGGLTNPGVSVKDVRSNPATSLSSAAKFGALEWGRGVHLEIAILDSQSISSTDPHFPGGVEMTILPTIVGNFVVGTLPTTFRILVDHADGTRTVTDSVGAAPIKVRFKASEIGSQAGITIVGSSSGTTSGATFVNPPSPSTSVLDLWRSRGCTIGDHTTIKVGNAACSTQQVAGGDIPETRTIQMGRSSGTFTFRYSTYSVQDRMIVTYEGKVLFDTGCVGASGSQTLTYSGTSTAITVQVIPNCSGPTTGTLWEYTVECPT